MSIVRTVCKFSAAHRLWGYKGDCGRLHGHNWIVEVEVEGDINQDGFVVDFRMIKNIIKECDHKVLLYEKDPLVKILKDAGQSVVEFSKNPTCENLAKFFVRKLLREVKCRSVRVRVWETDTSYAEAML